MRTYLVCKILVFCCLAIGCKGLAYKVPTGNMIPTIQIGDTVFVNQFAYSSSPIERFDIVVFIAPEEVTKLRGLEADTRYIKRVIGLPNEKLKIEDNKIYVNGKLLIENFEKITEEDDYKKNFKEITIPENGYFMLGDNRPNSEDSRYWKNPIISKDKILGKVVEIIHQEN
jgi:signal peptidase I